MKSLPVDLEVTTVPREHNYFGGVATLNGGGVTHYFDWLDMQGFKWRFFLGGGGGGGERGLVWSGGCYRSH